MTSLMEMALATVQSWPEAQQDEAAEILLALDRLGPAAYRAEADELQTIDEALAQVGRGEFASEAEVAAAFARFRK